MLQRRSWVGIGVAVIVVVLVGVRSYTKLTHVEIAQDATPASTPARSAGGAAPTSSTSPSGTGSGAQVHRKRDRVGIEETSPFGAPGSLAKLPDHYEGTSAGGYYVNLAGGPATIFAGGTSHDSRPKHSIQVVVLDGEGHPVAGAVVDTAAKPIGVMEGALIGDAGGTTDATGRATFDVPVAPGVAIAVAASGWSEPVAYTETSTTVSLVINGRGALRGRATYNGHAETFTVDLVNADRSFSLHYETNPDGTFEIAALAPGVYEVSMGLAQSITGGQSKKDRRNIAIENGKTAEIVVEQKSATDVVVSAKPPAGAHPTLVKAYVFTGTAAVDPSTARSRQKAEQAPSMMFGGVDAEKAIQFHDIAPGEYNVCIAAGDTIKTLGSFWACSQIRLLDGEEVREVVIPLVAVAPAP